MDNHGFLTQKLGSPVLRPSSPRPRRSRFRERTGVTAVPNAYLRATTATPTFYILLWRHFPVRILTGFHWTDGSQAA
jgi:hypothetical protein